MNEIKNKLSADPGATVLGIISLLIGLIGCCCGILAIPAIVMSVIGLIWAGKSVKAYNESPDSYTAKTYSNVKTAKILNLIGLILSSIAFIVSLIWFGSLFANPEELFEKLERGEYYEVETETNTYEFGTPEDSLQEIDTWEYEEAVDSIPINGEILEMEESTTPE